MELSHFPTGDLASRCAEESSKKKTVNRDDRFCFELVRRAFGLDDYDALGHVLNIYKDIWSRFWIRDGYVFETQSLTIEDFKSIAFLRVYEHFKGSAFGGFSSLTPLLKYFQVTLVRVVAHYIRSSRSQQMFNQQSTDEDQDEWLENVPDPENLQSESEKNLIRQAVDKRVAHLLPDDNDLLLFDLSVRQDMPPREIVTLHPDIWKNTDEVRKAKQNITRRLYKDKILNELLEGLL